MFELVVKWSKTLDSVVWSEKFPSREYLESKANEYRAKGYHATVTDAAIWKGQR